LTKVFKCAYPFENTSLKGNSMEKDKIRPYYSELQGYLSQAPTVTKPDALYDKSFWEQFNQTVDIISSQTGEDYNRFKVIPYESMAGLIIAVSTYRQKLGGFISWLHGKYFTDEPPPFSGMPSTVITQVQQQSVSVQMLLDIQTKIDEALTKAKGEKEQGFLKKFNLKQIS